MTADRPTTAAGSERLRAFLAFLTRQADQGMGDEATWLSNLRIELQKLVRHDDWLEPPFAASHPDRYQQHLLFCDPLRRFSVTSFVWGAGQQTPIHDHTIWGMIGMLRGSEVSEPFEYRDGKLIPGPEARLDPGEVMAVSPTIGDIHRVRNAFGDRVSISIHVYGGDIGAVERHGFSSEGRVMSFISGYSNDCLPNPWGKS